MSIRILWRSIVFLFTLALIYLLFPILIVPSSLPAIKAILLAEKAPAGSSLTAPATGPGADAQIYQLSIPAVPTFSQKVQLIKQLHQQGMDIILNRASSESR